MTWVWRARGLLWYLIRLSGANKKTTNKQIKQGEGIKEVFHCKMEKKVFLILFFFQNLDMIQKRLILLIVLILGSSYWAISFNCIIYKPTVVDLFFFFSFSCFHQEKTSESKTKTRNQAKQLHYDTGVTLEQIPRKYMSNKLSEQWTRFQLYDQTAIKVT